MAHPTNDPVAEARRVLRDVEGPPPPADTAAALQERGALICALGDLLAYVDATQPARDLGRTVARAVLDTPVHPDDEEGGQR